MIYYRCRCGSMTSYSSIGTHPCVACPECGTTLATHKDGHTDPKPHRFVRRYDTFTGKPYLQCEECMHKEIAKDDPESSIPDPA